MEETVRMLTETGVLLVIAAVFIWDKVKNSNQIIFILNEIKLANVELNNLVSNMSKENENTRVAVNSSTNALNLAQHSLSMFYESLERHDRRSEGMNSDISRIMEHIRREDEIIDMRQQKNTA